MISMVLALIEKEGVPETVLSQRLETEQAHDLFLKVKVRFSNCIVEKSRENRPYLYLKLVDVLGTSQDSMAYLMPNVCFRTDAREQIIEFINNIEKP